MLKGKKLVILVAIILFLFLGFVVVKLLKNGYSSNPDIINEKQYTVLLLEKGFEPEILKIKVGTKITFVNKDKVFRWPASDLHPTHAIYSDFDPKEPIKPGDLWEFTFEKSGEWNYHDHLSPLITGTIIVTQ